MYIVRTNFGSIFLQCTDWEDVQVLKVFFYIELNGRMYIVKCFEVFFTVH